MKHRSMYIDTFYEANKYSSNFLISALKDKYLKEINSFFSDTRKVSSLKSRLARSFIIDRLGSDPNWMLKIARPNLTFSTIVVSFTKRSIGLPNLMIIPSNSLQASRRVFLFSCGDSAIKLSSCLWIKNAYIFWPLCLVSRRLLMFVWFSLLMTVFNATNTTSIWKNGFQQVPLAYITASKVFYLNIVAGIENKSVLMGQWALPTT